MPRRSKREQTPSAPQDQGYGVRGEQIAAQNQMPLPQNRPDQVAAQAQPAGAPVAMAPQAPQDPNALLQMAQTLPPPPPGGLARPSERPDEGITTGLGVAQPAQKNVAADTFEQMAEATGDPRFRAMAQRARMI